jgi:hypothetical protein
VEMLAFLQAGLSSIELRIFWCVFDDSTQLASKCELHLLESLRLLEMYLFLSPSDDIRLYTTHQNDPLLEFLLTKQYTR